MSENGEVIDATASGPVTPAAVNENLGYHIKRGDYRAVAQTIKLNSNVAVDLLESEAFDEEDYIELCSRHVPRHWQKIVALHYQVLGATHRGDLAAAVQHQMSLTSEFLSAVFPRTTNVSLPVLFAILENLGQLAVTADSDLRAQRRQSEFLNRSMQLFQSAFAACMGDRSENPRTSKATGGLRIVNIQMRIFFRDGQTQLIAKLFQNVEHRFRNEHSSLDLAMSDLLTFRFWYARDCILNDQISDARHWTTFILERCPAVLNKHLEWTLLIHTSLEMVHGRLPTDVIWTKYPSLATIYRPIAAAIRAGSMRAFEQHVQSPAIREVFVLYSLVDLVDALRWLVLRRALKKLFLVRDRASRLSFADCRTALKVSSGTAPEMSGVESTLGMLIAMGLIRGYLSHEHATAVLSKQDPFPAVEDKVVRALELMDTWRRPVQQ
ncbi:COP9 signalosome (CSN) subunit [Blastocladiella emersonii ATCC 22665]|nr:COP9 signalosome (CSN) subunit [Blastocladiella emersonii ATCC 22665]